MRSIQITHAPKKFPQWWEELQALGILKKPAVHVHYTQYNYSSELSRDTTSAIPRHFYPVKGRLYKDSFTPILRTDTWL